MDGSRIVFQYRLGRTDEMLAEAMFLSMSCARKSAISARTPPPVSDVRPDWEGFVALVRGCGQGRASCPVEDAGLHLSRSLLFVVLTSEARG